MEFETFRHYEHCGFLKDDHLNYRKKSEIDYWLKNDCLRKLQTKVNKKKLIFFEKKLIKKLKLHLMLLKNQSFQKIQKVEKNCMPKKRIITFAEAINEGLRFSLLKK